MSRLFSFLAIACLSLSLSATTVYKPYTLTLRTTIDLPTLKTTVQNELGGAGFMVVGQYQPAADANRWVLVVTHPELTAAVNKVGGLTGFGATLRIALTRENGSTLVSYTTPEYWARAYFRDDYNSIAAHIKKLTVAVDEAFKSLPGYTNEPFGSKKGLDADDLDDYNYMIGMPEFDDTEVLRKYPTYQAAIQAIDDNVKRGVKDVKLVYKYTIPGKKLTVYGFALSGPEGESAFLPVIDIASPKHTAFLPYEILVMDNEVHMLHGRYRIAISFPDLTMGTFTKIMSTPGNIEEMMQRVVE